jgi:DNA-binding MarR family transcriptional regulator
MQQKEINALRLLEALSSGETQSQRDIAKKMKISLGLVNALLKNFFQKGYFETSPTSKGKVKYILTARGLAEKSELTYRYLRHSLGFYRDIREKLSPLFRSLKVEGKQRVVLYGDDELSSNACEVMKEHDLALVTVIDSKDSKIALDFDIILILEYDNYETIAKDLENAGVARDKILTF